MGNEEDLSRLEIEWRREITNYGSLCEEQGYLASSVSESHERWKATTVRRNAAAQKLFTKAARIEHRQCKLDQALRDLVAVLLAAACVTSWPEFEAAYAALREGGGE